MEQFISLSNQNNAEQRQTACLNKVGNSLFCVIQLQKQTSPHFQSNKLPPIL